LVTAPGDVTKKEKGKKKQVLPRPFQRKKKKKRGRGHARPIPHERPHFITIVFMVSWRGGKKKKGDRGEKGTRPWSLQLFSHLARKEKEKNSNFPPSIRTKKKEKKSEKNAGQLPINLIYLFHHDVNQGGGGKEEHQGHRREGGGRRWGQLPPCCIKEKNET